ncbi:cytochrome ubiquinol oxidase subunit I, partial [Actinotignum sanguinis]
PKAAAMMGVCQGEENAKLSLVMWGNSCEDATSIYVPIPGLESFMMTNHWSGPDSRLESISEANERVRDRIHQMENVNAELVEKFDTAFENQQVTPNVLASYYSFRVMVGVGMLDLLIAVLGLWVLRGDRIMRSERWGKFWLWMIPLQFVANSAGWILTEIGRQPWIVYPTQIDGVLLMTDLGVSHSVNGGSVAFSLTIFTVLYSALGVVWIWLLGRYLREGINTHKKVVEYDAKSTPNFVY